MQSRLFEEKKKLGSGTYRVSDPSCHPQISLCARIQKKTESQTGQPKKSPGLATHKKMAESPTLVSFGVTSPRLCHFLGVASLGLCFFWILAHREIWGWQEGSDTLYMGL